MCLGVKAAYPRNGRRNGGMLKKLVRVVGWSSRIPRGKKEGEDVPFHIDVV